MGKDIEKSGKWHFDTIPCSVIRVSYFVIRVP